MRAHGSALGQGYADVAHVQHPVEQEYHALIRKRRVAHCRADALEAAGQQVVEGQVLVRRIAPIATTDVAVEHFGRSFGQPVAQGLGEHTAIVVAVGEVLHPDVDRRGKDAETAFTVSLGRKIVRQTEIRLTLAGHTLLAQARNDKAPAVVKPQNEVVAVAPGCMETDTAIRMKVSGKPRKHADSIVIQSGSRFGLAAVAGWLRGQPGGAATGTVVLARHCGKARRNAPSMEEINPVDVGRHIAYAESDGLRHRSNVTARP